MPIEEPHHKDVKQGPAFTVITTVYNGAKFVTQFIENVQLILSVYPNATWLLVDDGSNDDTLVALKAAKDKDHRLSKLQVLTLGRMGRAAALNAAVAAVATPVFANHDFDDVSFPIRFSTQLKLLEENARLACVGAPYEHIDIDKGSVKIRGTAFDEDSYLRRFPLYVPFPHTVMTFRTAAVKEAGG